MELTKTTFIYILALLTIGLFAIFAPGASVDPFILILSVSFILISTLYQKRNFQKIQCSHAVRYMPSGIQSRWQHIQRNDPLLK